MRAEQIFRKVKKHLLKQNKKSVDMGDHGGCVYRSEDGTKCAVGCLIPARAYRAGAEGYGVSGLRVNGNRKWVDTNAFAGYDALAKSLNAAKIPATPKIKKLLESLQNVHDNFEPAQWPEELNKVYRERLARPRKKAVK